MAGDSISSRSSLTALRQPRGGPGCMCFGCLLLIGLDPLIDLVPVGAVVADGGLYEAERQLKIACRVGGSPSLSRTTAMISHTSLPVPVIWRVGLMVRRRTG